MNQRTIHVLAVEDNAGDARLISLYLEEARSLGWQLPYFDVQPARSLHEALACLEKGGIDVVLTDLDLPDSSAGDTFTRLHAHSPQVPIVVLTGREDETLAQQTVRAGAEDYLFKREMSGSLLAHALIYALERRQNQRALQKAHRALEERVTQRTEELQWANVQLEAEVVERIRVDEARERHVRELQTINDAIIRASRMEDLNEICTFLGESVQRINPKALVTVSLYNRESNSLRVRATLGPEAHIERASRLLGEHFVAVEDLSLEKGSCDIRPYSTGKLERLPGGLHALSAGRIPQEICRQIEAELRIGEIYAVGFALDEEPYGGIVVYLPHGEQLAGASAIETLASYFSLILRRRQVEQALQKSEQHFRRMYESSGMGIARIALDFTIEQANASCCQMTGYRERELVGTSLNDIIHPEDLGEHKEKLLQLIRGERETVRMEKRLLHKDGSTIWGLANTNLMRDAEGEPSYLLCNVVNITEQKEMEEALQESQQRYQRLAESAEAILWEFDIPDDRWTYVAPQATRILGFQPEEWTDLQFWVDHLHPEDRGWAVKYCFDCAQRGEPHVFEYRFLKKDGGYAWLRDVVSVEMRDGNPVRLYGFMIDISERKRAEAELERSNRELEQFAYVVSHDLRAPARAVSDFLQLLKGRYKEGLDAKAQEYVNYALDSTEQMEAMIEALLDLSRVETRGQSLAPTDLEELLQRTLRMLDYTLEEENAAVTSDPLPKVMGDGRQLGQVFQNLIANAIKFRRAGVPPQIHVGAEQQDGEWRFSVADNGIGIDPTQIDRLFQIFQRLHTEEEYPGSGIGLALCRRIVERHGGRIWVESEPGQGSTFFFTLPTASEA
jgi:PAS domain S-box-containing protein